MNNHTTEPMHIDQSGGLSHVRIDGVRNNETHSVATFWDDPLGPEVALANARLFKVAPKLLQMLATVLDQVDYIPTASFALLSTMVVTGKQHCGLRTGGLGSKPRK